jgi:hypothetical protein
MGENLICPMWQTCPSTIKDIEILAHFLNEQTKDITIEMSNP